MIKIILVALLTAVVSLQAELLQNANWRSPYFIMASEMGYAQKTGSGMFWDGIGSIDLFEKSLWLDSAKLKNNHLFFEPSINAGFLSAPPDTQDPQFWSFGILNSLVYKNIMVRQTLAVDKKYEYDAYYPSSRDRALRGRIDEAFIQANWKYGFLRLGRMERNWGPFADRSLLLSANPFTYDALEWQLQTSFLEFRHLFAAFPYEKSEWDTDGRQINRFFTAHSLNFVFGKWGTIGLFESVVFTREKGFPDFTYVNPISVYAVVNTNQEGDGNLMIGAQWNIFPFGDKISFRGQLLLDDFQVDDKTTTDKEPTHWGVDMGLYWKNPLPLKVKNTIKIEGNLRSRWLYTVTDDNSDIGERYTYLSKNLGAAENDGYRISAGLDMAGQRNYASSVYAAYEKNRGNTPLSRWNDRTHTPGLPYESYLPAEEKVDLGFNFYFYFKDYADLRLSSSNVIVKNENNILSSYKFKPAVKAELSMHFSGFIMNLPD